MSYPKWNWLYAVAGTAVASVLGCALTARMAHAALIDPSVRAQDVSVVAACAAVTAPGVWGTSRSSWQAVCTLPQHLSTQHPYPYLGDATDYTVTRLRNGELSSGGKPVSFRIDAQIVLDIQQPDGARPALSTQNLALQNTERCMPVLNHYWNAYGIDLNFGFALKKDGQPDTANTVRVILGAGRSNSRTFYYNGLDNDMVLQNGLKIPAGFGRQMAELCRRMPGGLLQDCEERGREVEYCTMALHEFGHRLGLPDEYADPMCPDRNPVSAEQSPWSIMAVPMVAPIDGWAVPMMLGLPPQMWGNPFAVPGAAEFFPRHLKQVLKPVCP